jgi:hypothetical protein
MANHRARMACGASAIWFTKESGFAGCTSLSPSPLADRVFAAGSFHYTVHSVAGASRARTANEPPRTKVELYEPTNKTSMTYIEAFDADLAAKLESGTETTEEIVRWVSEKVLESYRNGITAGQKGATVKRQGQSRRSGFPRRAE